MKIELHNITVRELANGYIDNNEDGVLAYGGRLDVRPPYQREFVYKEKQRDAVIDTLTKGYPLNVMYWAVRDDGTYEIIDGQQRTISICQYVNGDFSFKFRFFHNLQDDEKEQILNYTLQIYICTGTDSEKLKWFETINIAGAELSKQELRNAVYSGSFVTDAKRYFSRNGCPGYNLGLNYVKGDVKRQEFLERAIEWICVPSEMTIEQYMAQHQHDHNANHLWLYYQGVIAWVKSVFPKYRKEMKGLKWGVLYAKFKDASFNTDEIEEEVKRLMADDDVEDKKGIYEYILTRKEKVLNIRKFSDSQKRTAYERQNGICPRCNEHFDFEFMEGDHIVPWCKGGKTTIENLQMLCVSCNREKSCK